MYRKNKALDLIFKKTAYYLNVSVWQHHRVHVKVQLILSKLFSSTYLSPCRISFTRLVMETVFQNTSQLNSIYRHSLRLTSEISSVQVITCQFLQFLSPSPLSKSDSWKWLFFFICFHQWQSIWNHNINCTIILNLLRSDCAWKRELLLVQKGCWQKVPLLSFYSTTWIK